MKRVGIFAGTFDPVHAGHISFALKAAKVCALENVYFLPEQKPRNKRKTTKFDHRVKMLELAVTDHPNLDILTLPGKRFKVAKTLRQITDQFLGANVLFLIGSDVAAGLPEWKHAESLVAHHTLVVGLRKLSNKTQVQGTIKAVTKPHGLVFVKSPMPALASSNLRSGNGNKKMIPEVLAYAESNQLYNGND